MTRTRTLLEHPARLLGVVVAAAVVAALAASLYAASRPPRTLDRSTPQGVVQAYVTAVLDGDHATAATFLDPDVGCAAVDLDRTFTPRSVRVDLVETQVSGDSARVRVSVTFDAGADPLSGSPGEDHVFRLVRTPSGWLLSGIPWPLYTCEGGPR